MAQYRLVLALLAVALAAPALAQQPTDKVAGATPADVSSWQALLAAMPPPAEAPAAETVAMTARELTAQRFRGLRAHIPTSKVSLARQLAAGCRSRDASVRAEALQDVIYYATHYGDLVDLTGLVSDLMHVFQNDPDPAHRIMASQGIYQLADLDTVRELARLAQRDRSPQVRRLVLMGAASRIIADRAR